MGCRVLSQTQPRLSAGYHILLVVDVVGLNGSMDTFRPQLRQGSVSYLAAPNDTNPQHWVSLAAARSLTNYKKQ